MKNLFLITLCFFFLTSFAQKKGKESVWVEQPVFSEILAENAKENVVGIFLNEKYEYYHTEDGDFQSINTTHKKFRVNNDESINKFNKIWISLTDVIEVIEIRARAIKPNGKVVEFDEKNIKEVQDEDSGKSYKIFAIDGIENGDDIEYYVIRRLNGQNFGRLFFQFEYPLQKASFELITPKNILYAVKAYNGFPDAKTVVLEDERNQYSCELENIPLIKDEKFSYITPRKARIEFRLDYNLGRSNSQRLTWNDAAQRVYETMYLDINAKQLEKWINAIQLIGASPMEKAMQIENYLKDNVYIQENHQADFSDFGYIFENKVSSAKGIVGLYANLFKKYGINHQLVLTSERSKVKFDGDFQSWNYLDDYLIYLPDDDTYIDPSNNAFRRGCINGELTETEGLFIKLVKVGNFESAIGQIKYIKPSPYYANYHNMIIDITINTEDVDTQIVTISGLKGLSGGYIKQYYKMMDEDQKQKLLKDLMGNETSNFVFNKLDIVENCSSESIKDAEFAFISDINTATILEQAGNRLLLNVGETIGQQTEMYFEENRKALIENDFNRYYYREIVVHIPNGYKIVNPEVVDMSFTEKKGNENIFGFVSSHSIKGDELKIIIEEYYKEIFADSSQFKGFKEVVNAAADFNKIVLVLEEL